MGFFDQLKSKATQGLSGTVSGAVRKIGGKRETFTFPYLPQNVAQLKALPEANLTNAFSVAALVVTVLCRYEESPQDTIDMLNFLRGPRPLSPYEVQFLRDRLRGKAYVPRSYLAGTTPQNNYTPSVPYSVTVSDSPYSYTNEGYATLYIRSSGADSERSVQLRCKGNQQWFLWENFLMSDIRIPVEQDPWA